MRHVHKLEKVGNTEIFALSALEPQMAASPLQTPRPPPTSVSPMFPPSRKHVCFQHLRFPQSTPHKASCKVSLLGLVAGGARRPAPSCLPASVARPLESPHNGPATREASPRACDEAAIWGPRQMLRPAIPRRAPGQSLPKVLRRNGHAASGRREPRRLRVGMGKRGSSLRTARLPAFLDNGTFYTEC